MRKWTSKKRISLLVSNDDVVGLEKVQDVLDENGRSLLRIYVVALCVSKIEDVGEGHGDGGFSYYN
jgi:hypothetical protein